MLTPGPTPAEVAKTLAKKTSALSFAVPFVYNPLVYAEANMLAYLDRYGTGRKRFVWLGMNPGPFGMMQTGIPFGDVAMVRDFLGLATPPMRPKAEHPKRPIDGFACTRSEVSGTRLWGMVRDVWGTPDAFFREHMVWNYCPLVFLGPTGANITPDKLTRAEQTAIEQVCDVALADLLRHWQPELAIGVGAYAKKALERVVSAQGLDTVRVGSVLHPSPASPKANKDWSGEAKASLRALGVPLPTL